MRCRKVKPTHLLLLNLELTPGSVELTISASPAIPASQQRSVPPWWSNSGILDEQLSLKPKKHCVCIKALTSDNLWYLILSMCQTLDQGFKRVFIKSSLWSRPWYNCFYACALWFCNSVKAGIIFIHILWMKNWAYKNVPKVVEKVHSLSHCSIIPIWFVQGSRYYFLILF